MITETVCAESPVIRAISDLASAPVPAHEAQHQPLVLRPHPGLVRAALQAARGASSRRFCACPAASRATCLPARRAGALGSNNKSE